MSAYASAVSIRRLFSILIAVAMLLAPAMMGAGASAAGMTDHQMLMMDHSGHCQMPLRADHQKSDGKSCCVSMCVALAVTPSMPSDIIPMRRQVAQFAPPRAYHGLLTEIATPPPRQS